MEKRRSVWFIACAIFSIPHLHVVGNQRDVYFLRGPQTTRLPRPKLGGWLMVLLPEPNDLPREVVRRSELSGAIGD